ncbi:Ligand-Gated ion Channel [Ditylenchus destructor]|uniref:Ligand-Gated ion Channel n=1 Tax=Ditylenchus destructor TaxID=166010 RepID=A0AAD4QZE7_9BILA|nr:Ligand-Gated ion Channel [Ditylenchus destructor]
MLNRAPTIYTLRTTFQKKRNNFLLPKSVWFFLVALMCIFIEPCQFLTTEERGELARKFKYYHRSVRPSERFNLAETVNGTYFNLNSELETRLHLELMLIVHYNDDRLILRELPEILTMPDEFHPWIPSIELTQVWGPSLTSSTLGTLKTIHLDPKTGQLTVFHRISGSIACTSSVWKQPFERYYCELEITSEKDERIFLRVTRDLRPSTQLKFLSYSLEEWPTLVLQFTFANQWHSALVNIFLPSLLIFSVALFAQWKRRKMQVIVTATSIICIVIMQTAFRSALNTNAVTSKVNMQELWFSGILVHLICILTVDLLFPSRRIVYTTNDEKAYPKTCPTKKRTAVPTSTYRRASLDDPSQWLPVSNVHPGNRHFPGSQYPPVLHAAQFPHNRSVAAAGDRQVRFHQRPAPLPTYMRHPQQQTGIHEQLVMSMYDPGFDMLPIDIDDDVDLRDIKIRATEFEDDDDDMEEEHRPVALWTPVKKETESRQYPAFARMGAVASQRRSPPSARKRQIQKVTMGRKKRMALMAIFSSFVLFVCIYVGIAVYAINE